MPRCILRGSQEPLIYSREKRPIGKGRQVTLIWQSARCRMKCSLSESTEKFDLPYRRITEQILPMFPASVVGTARVEATESSAELLFLPPEAYG
jgi:hypothetical protein